jgi:hypothetical protein
MARVQLPSPQGAPRDADEPNVEEVTWRVEALLAGALGAFVVAAFFLFVDLAAGRPFWTPFVLGSAFFKSSVPPPGAAADPVLVLGYTAVHGLTFVAYAAMVAFHLDTEAPRPRTSLGRAALIAAFLFAAFELTFVAFARLFAPDMIGVLGVGRVALANALASIAMTGFVYWRAARGVGTRDMGPPEPSGSNATPR